MQLAGHYILEMVIIYTTHHICFSHNLGQVAALPRDLWKHLIASRWWCGWPGLHVSTALTSKHIWSLFRFSCPLIFWPGPLSVWHYDTNESTTKYMSALRSFDNTHTEISDDQHLVLWKVLNTVWPVFADYLYN